MRRGDKGRRDIDWGAIKVDYVADDLSLRELGRKYGCSHSAIANYAGRNGWVRSSKPETSRFHMEREGDPCQQGTGFPADSCRHSNN
jgi:hypothetical protein